MTTNNTSFTSRGSAGLAALSISSHMAILLNSEGRLHPLHSAERRAFARA
jgi:hypothetical protein